jgi:hypothetical protein
MSNKNTADDPILPGDQGGIYVQIGQVRGRIVLNFGKQLSWLGMSSTEARALAIVLNQHADDLELNSKRGATDPQG